MIDGTPLVPNTRKALLLGAAKFGAGFSDLPAVNNDIQILKEALMRCGFEVVVASDEAMSNAATMDAAIREFAETGAPRDFRLIYYSGHGVRLAQEDWIIPKGMKRHLAITSPNQRVSTDIGVTVEHSQTGFVLFVIDACRDERDSPIQKDANEDRWGADIDAGRFMRLYGCRKGEMAQILTKGDDTPLPVSIFTRALADTLGMDAAPRSLSGLLAPLKASCCALAKNAGRMVQNPRLSQEEEQSADTQLLMEMEIFRHDTEPGGEVEASMSGWANFDPNKFHSVVVLSERQSRPASERKDGWGPRDLMSSALSGKRRRRIWDSFRGYADGLDLVGRTRVLSEDFTPDDFQASVLSMPEVFEDSDSLELATRLIAEADLVLFDVTGFEPGSMLLLGIRAAARRGVTICSVGDGWREGEPMPDTPFNLRDLNFNSHTPAGMYTGANPVVEQFVKRVVSGFRQLAKNPNYLDLPVYDSLRQLGSDISAFSSIDLEDEVLVLCSYSETFFTCWEYLREGLEQELSELGKEPLVHRLIDLPTPQLVSQHLFERIRRTAACVVDWSEYSPSAFMETGVRLAVSRWGVVQVVESKHQAGQEKAPKLELPNGHPDPLRQIAKMQNLFQPITYSFDGTKTANFDEVADRLVNATGVDQVNPNHKLVYDAVTQAVRATKEAFLAIDEELDQKADAIHHRIQRSEGGTQQMHMDQALSSDAQMSALERRLAAWFYLHERVRAYELDKDDMRRKRYVKLGRAVITDLYKSDSDYDFDLAEAIKEKFQP